MAMTVAAVLSRAHCVHAGAGAGAVPSVADVAVAISGRDCNRANVCDVCACGDTAVQAFRAHTPCCACAVPPPWLTQRGHCVLFGAEPQHRCHRGARRI